MKKNIDVLVLGAGVAGAIAAVRAAGLGHRVLLVHKSNGTSAYSSGAIDVVDSKADEVPGVADPFARGEGLAQALAHFVVRKPQHPYAKLKENLGEFEAALQLLMDLTADLPLIARKDQHNHVLVTQFGTLKRCALVQQSLLFDVAALHEKERVGIVELSGLWGFDASAVANMLRWIAEMRQPAAFEVMSVRIDITPEKKTKWQSFVDAAYEFDDVAMQKKLAEKAREAVQNLAVRPTHLLFPAVLGLKNPMGVLKAVEDATAIPASELLASPPAVPGLRLSNALFAGLNGRGVECIEGQVSRYSCERGRIASVYVEHNNQLVEFAPQAVILATGRVLSGGIRSDGLMREAVFDLPIWTSKGQVNDRFSHEMTQRDFKNEHEIFGMGLASDEQMRPLNQFGELFAGNLYAAGSILGGYDPALDATGLGVAAFSGFLAGGFASKMLSN